MEHLWYMWCLHCFGNGCEMIWDAREGGPKQHLTSAATLESETSPNQTISTDVSENKRRNFVEVFKDSVCISYISFSFIGCSHGSTHQTNPLNITTLCRDRFLCGAATGLPLSAMAAMSDATSGWFKTHATSFAKYGVYPGQGLKVWSWDLPSACA